MKFYKFVLMGVVALSMMALAGCAKNSSDNAQPNGAMTNSANTNMPAR